jgi:Asp-tRNA(Asn)/Glu-tRNA(Gln) amidotransferase A subunit family amidase
MKIIILGAGQVGGTLAENLVGENNDITVIDTNLERLREMQDKYDLRIIAGPGSHPRILRDAGAEVVEISLSETAELVIINAAGGLTAAESYAWHRHHLQDPAKAALYDPRVRSRIERGASMSAADYLDLLAARKRWIARMESAIADYDALLSPTTAITVRASRNAERKADTRQKARESNVLEWMRTSILVKT